MSDTTRRSLRLLALLQARTVWTGPELAAELEITVRSVRRDIDRLRALGYPVVSERGHGGGYRLGAGKKLPPLLLEPDEAVAVGVGLRLASSSGITGLDQVAMRSLQRLENLSHESLRHRIAAISQAVDVVGRGGPDVDTETLVILSGAIQDRRQVRMDYVARGGEDSHRRLEPYRVLAWGSRWYLFAWDLDREDWRTFRLDRIQTLRTSTFGFTPRETPDVQRHLMRTASRDPQQRIARVRFHASRQAMLPTIPQAVGEIHDDGPASCVLTSATAELKWLALHLAALEVPMEILEPQELVSITRDLGKRLSAAAGSTTMKNNGGG